ncbi:MULTISPECIES: hypothetical protein [unclassified Sphingomonas]|uniref:hypothetical protein n=1 Tax=unclassified Sphingomonas TaxID=196159 RepID=UPI000927B2BD|nr:MULTISPECIES: hypothetical protein [unclassified Sphingomonas]OJU20174.1 MAG: hypothetical protein BGN95_22215 [Sphingomonas sp. 66-10]
MSNVMSRAASARRNQSAETKVPRERIVTLSVAADLCPQALLRVLGLIAQHNILPLSIAAERLEGVQHFAVDVDNLPDHALAVLLAKIEAIVAVQSASVRPAERARLPA